LILKSLILTNSKSQNYKIRDLNHVSVSELTNQFFTGSQENYKKIFGDEISASKKFALFLAALITDKHYSSIVHSTQRLNTTFLLDSEYSLSNLTMLDVFCESINQLKNKISKRFLLLTDNVVGLMSALIQSKKLAFDNLEKIKLNLKH